MSRKADKMPESETFLEIAAEATDPVEWAALMLTKVGKPGMTQGEAMDQVRAIVRHAITLAQKSLQDSTTTPDRCAAKQKEGV